jgi:hypothetical protein
MRPSGGTSWPPLQGAPIRSRKAKATVQLTNIFGGLGGFRNQGHSGNPTELQLWVSFSLREPVHPVHGRRPTKWPVHGVRCGSLEVAEVHSCVMTILGQQSSTLADVRVCGVCEHGVSMLQVGVVWQEYRPLRPDQGLQERVWKLLHCFNPTRTG